MSDSLQNVYEEPASQTGHSAYTDAGGLAAQRKWFDPSIERANSILLSDDIIVEWRTETEVKDGQCPVVAQVLQDGSGHGIQIKSVAGLKWTRIVLRLKSNGFQSIAAVSALIKIDETNLKSTALRFIIAECHFDEGNNRQGLQDTRVNFDLPSGKWFSMGGVFSLPAKSKTEYNLIINFPPGTKVTIAELDAGIFQEIKASDQAGEVEVLRKIHLVETHSPLKTNDVRISNAPIISSSIDLSYRFDKQNDDLFYYFFKMSKFLSGAILFNNLMARIGLDIRVTSEGQHESAYISRTVYLDILSSLIESEFLARDSDINAIQAIGASSPSQPISVEKERNLHVVFAASPSDDDHTYWQKVLKSGFISSIDKVHHDETMDGQVVELLPSARLAPVTFAYLSSAKATKFGVDLQVDSQTHAPKSWEKMVIGFPDNTSTSSIGSLSAVDGALREPHTLRAGYIAAGDDKIIDIEEISPEDAYAFIINHGAVKDISNLINVENCLVFDSYSDLDAALSEFIGLLDRKPVVPLHRHQSIEASHIIDAVQQHWAYGGRYTITAGACSYDRELGNIVLDGTGAKISGIAFYPSVVVWPAAEATEIRDAKQIFLPSNGIAISVPFFIDNQANCVRLQHFFKKEDVSRADASIYIINGPFDSLKCRELDVNKHWALGDIVTPIASRHYKMRRLLAYSSERLEISCVEELINLIDIEKNTVHDLEVDISKFLVACVLDVDFLLSLPCSSSCSILRLARYSDVVDDVAKILALHADVICSSEVNLIVPTFELLACGLEESELTSVLAFCSARCTSLSDLHLIHISECVRRYGNISTLVLLLNQLRRSAPDKLEHSDILRNFRGVLDVAGSAARFGVCEKMLASISSVVNPSDLFINAVRNGDSSSALRITRHSSLVNVDFYKWMDKLRGLSNELTLMRIPVEEFSEIGLNKAPKRVLASTILCDLGDIWNMYRDGYLGDENELNYLALNRIRNNGKLNNYIANMFIRHAVASYQIDGENIVDVFKNAANSFLPVSEDCDKSLVTVIMSAFNPDLIIMEQSLLSISAQSHKNLEVIVIDDASSSTISQGISALCARFEFVRIIRMEKNCGPYIGRNIALKQAKGSFIAIHDADDWAHPNRIEVQLKIMKNNLEVQLVTTEHIRIDRAGFVQFEADFLIKGDGPMSSLFRRSTFEEIGMFSQVRSRGDVEMRERIRSYYGHQSISIVELPMMLCFGDSGTLSQQTIANKGEYLQMFRSHISQRRDLSAFRRAGRVLNGAQMLQIPRGIRAGDIV